MRSHRMYLSFVSVNEEVACQLEDHKHQNSYEKLDESSNVLLVQRLWLSELK